MRKGFGQQPQRSVPSFMYAKRTRMMYLWGIGIKMTILSLIYLTVASYLTYLYPDFFLIKNVPYPFFVAIGIILLIVGIPMLIISASCFVGKICQVRVLKWAQREQLQEWSFYVKPEIIWVSRLIWVNLDFAIILAY